VVKCLAETLLLSVIVLELLVIDETAGEPGRETAGWYRQDEEEEERQNKVITAVLGKGMHYCYLPQFRSMIIHCFIANKFVISVIIQNTFEL